MFSIVVVLVCIPTILFYFIIFLLYNIVLVLPYINMDPPWVYTCILYPASNLDWRFVSYMILYMFQCHSPKSSHPLPLPESKRLFYTSVSLLLSHIQGYRYHLSKVHIYALVYCIVVFLSGLLHSV